MHARTMPLLDAFVANIMDTIFGPLLFYPQVESIFDLLNYKFTLIFQKIVDTEPQLLLEQWQCL